MRYKAHILSQKRVALQEAIPLPAPFTVLIEVSRLCNFRCVFCPQGDRAAFPLFSKNLMDLETFERIADQMLEFPVKIKKAYLHGTGESTLNPLLPEMIGLLKRGEAAEYIDLTTNGALLTETLSRNLVKAGLDHLHISVEALSTEQYAEVTGVTTVDFNRFVEGVRIFSRLRQDCRLSIKIAGTSLASPADKKNFVNIFGPLGDEIFVENIFPIWPGFSLPASQILENQEAGQYGQALVDKEVCPQIFSVLAVKADGSVSPCSVDWSNKAVLGNIQANTLKDMWAGEKLKYFRLTHLSQGRKTIQPCAACGLPHYSCLDNLDAYRQELAEKIGLKG